jgi:hypothetical protein
MIEKTTTDMLQIGDTIISLDLFDVKFICDIPVCKGSCCVHGDSGAPLEDDEVQILKKIYPIVKPYLQAEGIKAIEEQGTSLIDSDGDEVTPLINNKECAFTIFDKGIALCGIEKAYVDGLIDFQKPLSCHLYPVRIKKYPTFDAVNYDEWELCKPACALGKKEGLQVYKFLKDPLIRKYGKDWYEELEIAADALKDRL